MRLVFVSALLIALKATLFSSALSADDVDGAEERFVSPNSLGGIGLLQTRTARFGPDGLFHFGYSRVEPYRRVYLTAHGLPWLEGTFRYTEIRDQLYSIYPWFSGFQTYKDRGADLKFRLLKEGIFKPALAVGFQDGLGTGVFTSEYLVASKRFWDFDFSLGLGWGYLGSKGSIKNPFIAIDEAFRSRTGKGRYGGTVILDSFFGGETVGLFGGFEYRTPIEGLTFKFEYDGHNYDLENARPLPHSSDYNFGFNFRPYPWVDIALGHERGERTMLRISLRAELHEKGIPKFEPPPPAVNERPTIVELVSPVTSSISQSETPVPPTAPISPKRKVDPAKSIFEALENFGLVLESFQLIRGEAKIEVSSFGIAPDYQAVADAVLFSLPKEIHSVVLSPITSNGTSNYLSQRSLVQNNSTNDLFEALDELDIELVDFEIINDRAIISVITNNSEDKIPEFDLASIAIKHLKVSLVSIQDARTKLVNTWYESAGNIERLLAVEPIFNFPLASVDPEYTEEQRIAVSKKLAIALEDEGFYLESLNLQSRKATVAFAGAKYRSETRNIGFATRIIVNYLPAPIEEITVVRLNGGMEVSRITFLRTAIEKEFKRIGSPDEVLSRATIEPGRAGWPEFSNRIPGRYPKLLFQVGPEIRQHLGGPDQFYLYQFWVSGSFGVDIARGLSISGKVGANLYHNFDKIKLASDSVLPHVRSDIKHYLQQGSNNIVNLETDFFMKIHKNLYGRISAGMFEEMFGGVGAEVLYRTFDSRYAISAEWNRVRKRTFDQRLDFFQYEVDTGHIGIFYEEPVYNVLFNLRIARYLAGDKGATLEISRLFDSGIRMGAWATLTDVPFAKFGEGSFDKGFFIVVPFEIFLTKSSNATGVFAFRPLYRDGGMLLIKQKRLYDVTMPASLDTITRDWPQIFK